MRTNERPISPDIDTRITDSIPSRYNLSEQEAEVLSNELLESLPIDKLPENARFVSTEFEPDSKFTNLSRYIEGKVFIEEFGNDSQTMATEYGPYEHSSRSWIVCDTQTRRPVGALRAIQNSAAGLKTLNDIDHILGISPDSVKREHDINLDKTWDVGTVAVLPEYRGFEHEFLPSLILYRSLYARGVELGIDHFISIIDEKAEGNLRLLGMPFKPIMNSSSFSYLGSEHSTALYSRVDDLAKGVQARMDEVSGQSGINEVIYKSCDALHNGYMTDELRLTLP